MFDAAKAKIILSSGQTLNLEIIPITFFTKKLKIRWLRELEGLGLVIGKQSDNVYSFVYKGVEIFKGTKAEAETALKEYFENSKKGGLERYLDEVLERRKIFLKWAEKFEKKFHHHFDGEIVVGKWSKRDGTPTLWTQGAHNHTVNGIKINIKEIRKPVVSRIENIPNDVPFKANVEVIYSNRNIPKQNTSSFFPKNWDINRIKEEIAVVYDEMIQSGFELKYSNNKYFTTNRKGFNIQIEVDDLGNLTNAYPLI